MKQILKKIALIILIIMLNSCDENEAVSYDNVERIYFTEEEINFSFGDKGFSIQDTIIEFPVRVMGKPSSNVRTFQVEINEEETTAVSGLQFETFPEEFEVPADSINAFVPIKLLRSGIDPTDTNSLTISLEIIDGGDFVKGVKESLSGKLTFNNFLEEPSWWEGFGMSFFFGDFQSEKYQKYIENHGSAVDDSYVSRNFLNFLKEWVSVRCFFIENPQYGVTFPDNADRWAVDASCN